MSNVLVICPLKAELIGLKTYLETYDSNKDLGDLKTHFGIGGRGKVQMAIQTLQLLEQYSDTNLVVCAGTAGALEPSLKIGDIVIGTSSVEHDWKQIEFGSSDVAFRPPPSIATPLHVLEKFNHLPPDLTEILSIHMGPIASGDEDVVEKKRAIEIQRATNALAVAWEGAGIAKACANKKISWVEIRVITDLADENTIQDFRKNLDSGMQSIGKLLAHTIL